MVTVVVSTPAKSDDWGALAATMSDPDVGPAALETVSRAVLEGRGGKAARDALHAGLAAVAKLDDRAKDQWVAKLQDPAAIFVPIAVSQSPHSYEAHLMAARMFALLESSGTTVSKWVAANGADKYAGLFYLRLDAYDRLHTYVNKHPDEAKAVAGAAFASVGSVKDRAHALQALTERMIGKQTTKAATEAYARGAIDAIDTLPKDRARSLALMVEVYADKFGALKDEAHAKAKTVLGDAWAAPSKAAPPYSLWPQDELRAVFHFADAAVYLESLKYYKKQGYKVNGAEDGGVRLNKKIGGVTVTLIWKSYDSDEAGFLTAGELERYEAAMKADLESTKVQLLFLRAHSEVSKLRAFDAKVAPGKVFFDGSCRGVWSLSKAVEKCAGCQIVANVGGGSATVNDIAGAEILEGLAKAESWDQIRDRLKTAAPSGHQKFLGPWNPPFAEALAAPAP